MFSIQLSAKKVARIVTRAALDKVVKEHEFQMIDWSDDKKTAELGKALSANWVVRGTLQKLDGSFITTVSILDVKTLEVMGGGRIRMASIGEAFDLMNELVDQTAHTMTGGSGQTNISNRGDYQLGGFGPAGGRIFYDKGAYSNGWRYLEAAPFENEFEGIQWGAYEQNVEGTSTRLGTGKQNTQIVVDYLRRIGESGKAAQLCDSLVIGEYSDWFLPSKDELNLMYENLKKKGLGEFSNSWYWSSSQIYNLYSWDQYFSDGRQDYYYKYFTHSVRAVRAF
jgi:hypothetical protein